MLKDDFRAYLESRGLHGDEVQIDVINNFLDEIYNELPMLISVPDAACLLGVSRKTGYEMAKKGQLPIVKLPNNRIKVNTRRFLELYEGDD
jgi:excisionase family DNA binding protein